MLSRWPLGGCECDERRRELRCEFLEVPLRSAFISKRTQGDVPPSWLANSRGTAYQMSMTRLDPLVSLTHADTSLRWLPAGRRRGSMAARIKVRRYLCCKKTAHQCLIMGSEHARDYHGLWLLVCLCEHAD